MFQIVLIIVALASHAYAQQLRGGGLPSQNQTTGCKGSVCDGVPEDRFAVLLDGGGHVAIRIGQSPNINEKCVQLDSPVACEEDAGSYDKRLNDNAAENQFVITVKNAGSQVCARRID